MSQPTARNHTEPLDLVLFVFRLSSSAVENRGRDFGAKARHCRFSLSKEGFFDVVGVDRTVCAVVMLSLATRRRHAACRALRFSSLSAEPTTLHLNTVEENRRQVLDVTQLKPGKNSFCRCWRSKKMPHCDGAHKEYNRLTGDMVGPVVVMNGPEEKRVNQ